MPDGSEPGKSPSNNGIGTEFPDKSVLAETSTAFTSNCPN